MGIFPSRRGLSYGQVLAAYDADSRMFELPAYVRQMSGRERRAWMRDNHVVPAIGGGAYSMFEMMQPFMDADFTAVTTPASKTALSPDVLFTVPANFFSFPGKALWFHAVGVLTTTATPGTYTFTLNWGGAAGTVLATTGAIAPSSVVNTNTLWFADFYVKARATGALTTSLTLTAYGVVQSPSFLVPTTQAIYGVNYAPPNTGTPGTALADITSLDGTIAKALNLAVTPTVTTGSIAMRDGWVVALN